MKQGILFAIIAFCILAVPMTSFAAASSSAGFGLVTCGTHNTPPCNLCDLFKLAQNIINFLMNRAVPLIAFTAVVIAGFMMILAGADPGLFGKGKSILTTTMQGLVLVFAAWLLTNTIIHALAGSSNISTKWYAIECHSSTTSSFTSSGGGTPNQPTPSTPTGGGGTPTSKAFCEPVFGNLNTSGCQANYTSDPNCPAINNNQNIKQYVTTFQCQSAADHQCHMSQPAADHLVAFMQKFQQLGSAQGCRVVSINGTIEGPTGPSKSNCHINKGGLSLGMLIGYGACADLSISSHDSCMDIFKQAAQESGVVSSYLDEYYPPPQGCQTGHATGQHIHVNF